MLHPYEKAVSFCVSSRRNVCVKTKWQRRFFTAMMLGTLPACGSAAPRPQEPFMDSPVVQPDTVKRVSPHVWMIPAFPNIGIVVGDGATLVVDTALGERNGVLIS